MIPTTAAVWSGATITFAPFAHRPPRTRRSSLRERALSGGPWRTLRRLLGALIRMDSERTSDFFGTGIVGA